MTIICPRCAARFSVVGTSGISCPACGARLALRDDPSRRSSTPSAGARRAPASAPVIDLPVPKRALTVTLDTQLVAARVTPGLGGTAPGRRSGPRSQERWRMRLEQLADLPEPIGEQPRTGRKAPLLRGVGAQKAVASAAAPAPVERAAPRIPVTRPEIPAGLPVRNDAATQRDAQTASLETAAATKQELAPVAASRKSPARGPAVSGDAPIAKAPVAAAPEPVRAAVVTAAAEPVAVIPAAPPSRPAAATAAAAPAVDAVAVVRAPASAPLAAPTGPAARAANDEAQGQPTAPATRPPTAALAAPQAVAGSDPASSHPESGSLPESDTAEKGGRSGDAADAAAPTASDQLARSDETTPPADLAPPPALQLGWVIAALLGLAALLVYWIFYRARVGH